MVDAKVVRHLNLCQLLSAVEYAATRRLMVQLALTDVGVDECRVLSLLADAHGHSMSEVAAAVMLPAPTVTRLIDRMVAANLVYRRPDDSDRRRLLVLTTTRGVELYREIDTILHAREAEVAAILGADSQVLADLLARLLRGFERIDE